VATDSFRVSVAGGGVGWQATRSSQIRQSNTAWPGVRRSRDFGRRRRVEPSLPTVKWLHNSHEVRQLGFARSLHAQHLAFTTGAATSVALAQTGGRRRCNKASARPPATTATPSFQASDRAPDVAMGEVGSPASRGGAGGCS